MRAMLQRWRQEPIIIPRWLLVTVYGLFIVLGIVAAFAGLPTLNLATPSGYVTPYAVAIAVVAALSIVGSSRADWARYEMVGALLLASLLTAVTLSALSFFVMGDLNRGAFSIVLIILNVLPAARGFGIMVSQIRTAVARWKLRRDAR